jgi:copper(I)-binding protein
MASTTSAGVRSGRRVHPAEPGGHVLRARGRWPSRTVRAVRVAALAGVLAVSATACLGSARDTAKPAPSPTAKEAVWPRGTQTVPLSGGGDLVISGVRLHPAANGTDTLTMSVKNGGTAPETLNAVLTPAGGRSDLTGSARKDGAGAMGSAGVLVPAGDTVTFGGHGDPAVSLHGATDVRAGHWARVIFQFGVAGLVRAEIPVAAS